MSKEVFALFSNMGGERLFRLFFFFFMKLCVARTFLVTLHLDDVLGVLRVLGLKFIFYKSFR